MTTEQKLRQLQQTLLILSRLCQKSGLLTGRGRLLRLIEGVVGEIMGLVSACADGGTMEFRVGSESQAAIETEELVKALKAEKEK